MELKHLISANAFSVLNVSAGSSSFCPSEKSFVMVLHRAGLCFVSERRPRASPGRCLGWIAVWWNTTLASGSSSADYKNRVLRNPGTQLPFQRRTHDGGMFCLHLQLFSFYEHTRRRLEQKSFEEFNFAPAKSLGMFAQHLWTESISVPEIFIMCWANESCGWGWHEISTLPSKR